MKAKLYISENQFEVRVGKKVYSSNEGQTKKDFLKHVNTELEKDFDEAIDIVEVKIDNLKKLDDVMLTEAYKVSGGLQEKILSVILAERGITVEKIEKAARLKVEKVDIEVAKASDAYKAAKENVGKLVQYTPAKSEEVLKGIIKSICFNKTNTIIYYNVQVGDKLKCCTATNTTLQFFEF
jgi:hypothetical protein